METTAETLSLIELRGVVKIYTSEAGNFTALKGIDAQVMPGEFLGIIGKSGAGKSTLLNMMTGIDHPASGQVIIGGTDLYAMTENQRSLWRGRNLGIVFQFFQLLPMLSLLENVMLPMDFTDTYEVDERPRKAMELLEMVGLEKFAHKLPLAVSTGQQQAAIARALATNPTLIAADEPTGNLDSRSAESIIALFEQLASQGKTIVMVTHDPSITERMSRTIILSDNETCGRAAQSNFQPVHRSHSDFRPAGLADCHAARRTGRLRPLKTDRRSVEESQTIKKDTVLIRLANREQAEAALATANLELTIAQQAFDEFMRTTDIHRARAWQTYMQAQAERGKAEREWEKLNLDNIEDDIEDAQANVRKYKKELEDAQEEFNRYKDPDKNNSQRKQAKTNLEKAEENYNEAVRKAVTSCTKSKSAWMTKTRACAGA